jgi:hypothetical protein
MKYEYGTMVEWWQVETEVFGEKNTSRCHFVHHKSHRLNLACTLARRYKQGHTSQRRYVCNVWASVTSKGRDISRWLPQLHYQLRGAIISPSVPAKCNTCVMTKPQVRPATTAGEIHVFTNPTRLQHMRYTDFILREAIFFCKKVFKFSLFFNT